MENNFDVTVIGGGPAGYTAAIRSAKLGLKTLLVEKAEMGGICLNWGCIPAKSLLYSAHLHAKMKRAQEYGINATGISPDLEKIIQRSRNISSQMSKGISFLMKKNKIQVIQGIADITQNRKIKIKTQESEVEIQTEFIILATGAQERKIPEFEIDHDLVLSSKDALILSKIPESIAILGGGVIGSEFACFYSSLGVKTYIIEVQETILPVLDSEVSKIMERNFKKRGIEIFTGVKINDFKKDNGKIKLKVQYEGVDSEIIADKILVSVGFEAGRNSSCGISDILDQKTGFIDTDDSMKTKLDNIYAAGDCTGPPFLAHVSSHEGLIAAESIAIRKGLSFHPSKPLRYNMIPSVVYTHPEVGSIGFTEKELIDKNKTFQTGRYPYTANGRAWASGENTGFVKVFSAEDHSILGAHIVGENASEILSEISTAIYNGISTFGISHTIHSHPTFSEGIMEAFLDSNGEGITI